MGSAVATDDRSDAPYNAPLHIALFHTIVERMLPTFCSA